MDKVGKVGSMGKDGSMDRDSMGSMGKMENMMVLVSALVSVLDNNTAVVLLLRPPDSHIRLMKKSLPQIAHFDLPK
jgi:hypothetical protein